MINTPLISLTVFCLKCHQTSPWAVMKRPVEVGENTRHWTAPSAVRGDCAAASTWSHTGNSKNENSVVPGIYEQQGHPCRGRLQPCAPRFPSACHSHFQRASCHRLMRECGSVVAFRCQRDPIVAVFLDRDHKIAEEVKSHTFNKWWLDVRTASFVAA